MPRRLYIAICWIMTLLLAETAIRTASNISYQIKFYTNNPYQQRFLDDVTDWKGIARVSKCPQPPGAMINGFVINSRGFATPDHAYDKPPGTKRIVLLGDSYAVGAVSYNNTFIRVLDRHLNENNARVPYEVINLGIACIGPKVERKILEIEGVKYKPDLVMLSFFVGNDFLDDAEYVRQNTTFTMNRSRAMPRILYNSKFITFMKNYIEYSTKSHDVISITKPDGQVLGVYTGENLRNETTPSFSEEDYLYMTGNLAEIMTYSGGAYDYFGSVFQDIYQMKKISDSMGAKFMVVIFPAEFQVNKDILRKSIAKADRQVDDYDVSLPQRNLRNVFEEHAIEYVDLLEHWMDDPNATLYYLPQDSHLNSTGNAAAERIIYQKILPMFE